ncbi:MAG: hypothetical protein O7C63_08455, partial [Alphaproteobacteria bacterium]|nr:hypothetical protein [Alphaproteobacteria bacterium]
IGQFARFIVVGTLLGLVGFWALPIALASVLPPISIGYSSVTVSLFMAWLTINVHHYFLDNVIWRRENPDTRKYLFS